MARKEASAKSANTPLLHGGSVTPNLSCADGAFLRHPLSLHTSSWSRAMNLQVPVLLAFLTTDSFWAI